MSNENIIGSTLTPTTTLSPKFIGNTGQFDALNLTGVTVNKILDTPDEDRSALFTAYGASLIKQELDIKISGVEEDIADVYFSPVLSDSVVNTHFIDKNIALTNCVIDLQNCVSINKTITSPTENDVISVVVVGSEAFNLLGRYFVEFRVGALPSGKIVITNEKNETLKTIYSPGTYLFDIITTEDKLPSLTFTLYGSKLNDVIKYTYIGVHHVKTAFASYFEYMVEAIQAGDKNYITTEDLAIAIDAAKLELRKYVNTQVSMVDDRLTIHQNDRNNPHELTPALIHAANEVHKHTLSDISDYESTLLVDIAKLQQSVTALTTTVDEHKNNKNNPHALTPTIIGAADKVHTHTTDDVISVNTDKTLTTTLSGIDTTLTTHVSATGNVHKLKFDDLTPPYATQAEAIDGVLNDKIMSPLNTKTVVDNFILEGNTENIDVARLTTRYVSDFSLNNTASEVVNHVTEISFPVDSGNIYHININDIHNQLNPSNVKIYFDNGQGNATGEDKIISTFTYIKDASVVSSVSTAKVHSIAPNDAEIVSVSGIILCNLNSMQLTSSLVGKVFKELEQSTTFTEVSLSSINVEVIDPTSISLCHLYIENKSIRTKLSGNITRLVSPSDPSIIVDALPVGTVINKYTSTFKEGYLLLDGSEMSRVNHGELYAEVIDSGNIITKEEWVNLKDSVDPLTGIVPYFHYGDGTTTFGLPYIPKNVYNQYSYIKAKSVVVPGGPTNLVYDYIWQDNT